MLVNAVHLGDSFLCMTTRKCYCFCSVCICAQVVVLHIFTSDYLGYPAKLLQYSMMSVALFVIGVLNLD